MSAHSSSKNPAVLSYHEMLRAVGVIALSLPFALAAGKILMALVGPGHALPHPLLERSISDYYYTSMRNLYVGSLCAIAAFMACSRGYDVIDEIIGYVAAGVTFGVALFPPVRPRSLGYTGFQIEIGFIHTAFAAVMYLLLACICIFRFRKRSRLVELTRRKRHRNRIYGVCGGTIVWCMVAMVCLTIVGVERRRPPSPWLFWCESLALAAFGVAWLTKGEGLLRDRPHNHVRPEVSLEAEQTR